MQTVTTIGLDIAKSVAGSERRKRLAVVKSRKKREAELGCA
jgi:hypothetical protein